MIFIANLFCLLHARFKYESRCVWQVVSREGMLGSAESLSRLPQSRAVTYLKVNKQINKQNASKQTITEQKSQIVGEGRQGRGAWLLNLRSC